MKVQWQRVPLWFPRQHASQHVRHRSPIEGPLPGEHFEQHDTECPYVRPLVSGLTTSLFGAHVRGSTEDDSLLRRRHTQSWGVRQAGVGTVANESLRQPEVQHFHLAVSCDLDIARLQIAVDDALLVCSFESFGDLEGQLEGFFDGDGTTFEPILKRVAFHEFKDKKLSALVFFETVDRRDVGMVQRGQQLRLTFKPGEALFVPRKLLGEGLDRNLTP